MIHADLLERIRGAIPDGVPVLVVARRPRSSRPTGSLLSAGEVPAGAIDWDGWREQFAPLTASTPRHDALDHLHVGDDRAPEGRQAPPYTEEELQRLTVALAVIFGFTFFDDPQEIVTAIVGPIYHSAPNTHAIFSFRVGASIHLMPRFDPEQLLALIERERITHLHMVPIMFERLLKLPEKCAERYDVSSLRFVVHAAAPCSPQTKRAMIEWWGPVIHEYYGSTEVGPVTFLTAEEWLEHPGSVGKPMEGAT